MLSRGEYKRIITERLHDFDYDEGTDTINYKGESIPLEKAYDNFIKKNGMSFDCIFDAHWECMSMIRCTECGTVVRYSYDSEDYEPNFKCPTCTDYKTGYEYYTKEQIEKSDELKAIIDMYQDLGKNEQERSERRKQRNGLEDYQLCKRRHIRTKNNVYDIDLLIDSIENKNKLKGLRLEISKWKKVEDNGLSFVCNKTIPLSKSAYMMTKRLSSSQENVDYLKGKSLTQIMEEAAVLRLKR